jgi:hypothetical protein
MYDNSHVGPPKLIARGGQTAEETVWNEAVWEKIKRGGGHE